MDTDLATNSLPRVYLCTVTFVEKEEGQQSLGFRCAKTNFRRLRRQMCLVVLLSRRRVNPPPLFTLLLVVSAWNDSIAEFHSTGPIVTFNPPLPP